MALCLYLGVVPHSLSMALCLYLEPQNQTDLHSVLYFARKIPEPVHLFRCAVQYIDNNQLIYNFSIL